MQNFVDGYGVITENEEVFRNILFYLKTNEKFSGLIPEALNPKWDITLLINTYCIQNRSEVFSILSFNVEGNFATISVEKIIDLILPKRIVNLEFLIEADQTVKLKEKKE